MDILKETKRRHQKKSRKIYNLVKDCLKKNKISESNKMKIITKQDYFNYMEETAKIVNPEIENYFEGYKENKGFFHIFEPLLKKRLKFPQLRTVISRLS